MKMTVELQPFGTPNYVIQKMAPRPKQDGIVECPKYHLRELDAETLAGLCDQFRREIFEKAGKSDPLNGADETRAGAQRRLRVIDCSVALQNALENIRQ